MIRTTEYRFDGSRWVPTRHWVYCECGRVHMFSEGLVWPTHERAERWRTRGIPLAGDDWMPRNEPTDWVIR